MLLSKATYSAFRLYIFGQYVCVLWELNLEPSALLTQCFTPEPQEHNPKMRPKINDFDHNTANETEHCYKIQGLFKDFST